MNFRDHLVRLFAYDAWANQETLTSLRTAAVLPNRSVKLLAHIAAAERLWLSRLGQIQNPGPVWPVLNLAGCAAELTALSQRWDPYIRSLSDTSLVAEIGYVNSKGVAFDSAVQDVLLHVITHSAYHRGQIASDMRAAGNVPAYTDFIHARRKGLVR